MVRDLGGIRVRVRLHHRRRRVGRLRAGQPADARTGAIACCCWRRGRPTAASGSRCRSATARASTIRPSTGCTRPSRSRASTAAPTTSRAARCWAAPAPSTPWSIRAARPATSTTGRRWAIPAGAGRRAAALPADGGPRAGRRACHGAGGPLHVTRSTRAVHPLTHICVKAGQEAGLDVQSGPQRRDHRRRRHLSDHHASRLPHVGVARLSVAGARPAEPAHRDRGAGDPHPVRGQARGRRRL